MTAPGAPVTTETVEPTVAEKRAALRAAGHPVGTRGRLSAAQEEAFKALNRG